MPNYKIKRADEQIIDYFLELKNWAGKTKSFYIKNGIPPYNRFLLPARDLLDLVDGNIERAKKLLEITDERVGVYCPEWQIETAILKYMELKKFLEL